MFLRVKKRTNNSGKTYEYGYLVINTYRKRRRIPKQKVKRYLGRVYRFEKEANQEIEALETRKRTIIENIVFLITNELKNYGFQEKEGFWHKEPCMVQVEQGICTDQQGRNVCIAINDGFMHASTLAALTAFKPKEGLLEKQIGKQLGNALISAGIRPKNEVFISLFQQVIKTINNRQQSTTIPNNAKQ